MKVGFGYEYKPFRVAEAAHNEATGVGVCRPRMVGSGRGCRVRFRRGYLAPDALLVTRLATRTQAHVLSPTTLETDIESAWDKANAALLSANLDTQSEVTGLAALRDCAAR